MAPMQKSSIVTLLKQPHSSTYHSNSNLVNMFTKLKLLCFLCIQDYHYKNVSPVVTHWLNVVH